VKQKLVTFIKTQQSEKLDETWYLFGLERGGRYLSPYSKKKGGQPLIPHPPMTPEARRSLIVLKARVTYEYDFDGEEGFVSGEKKTGSSKKAAYWGDLQDQLYDVFRLATWAGLRRPLKLPPVFEQVQKIVDFYTGYYCADPVIRSSFRETDRLFPNFEDLERVLTSRVKDLKTWVHEARQGKIKDD
jgi:hypothetical protein